MGDRLLTEADIEDLCICKGSTKDEAVEFQTLTKDGLYKTVFYFNIDCPLHGITRMYARNAPEFKGPPND